MGNKKLNRCLCGRVKDPKPIKIDETKLRKSSFKPLKSLDFDPVAFFVFTNENYVTYSWVFRIRQGSLCHVNLKSYMGKSIISLIVDDVRLMASSNYETEST